MTTQPEKTKSERIDIIKAIYASNLRDREIAKGEADSPEVDFDNLTIEGDE